MISDITFGQYFPCNSVLHKMDPRVKFIIMLASIVFLFLVKSSFALGLVALFVIISIIASKIPLKLYVKNLKAILPIIILTAIINSLYINDGRLLFSWWIFNITVGGISRALFMAVRIALLIFISATLTYTTTPNDLTDGIESLCTPLKFLGLGSLIHILTMMMTIALRFIPTLVEETQKIINAQKARGADIENGGIVSRVKALVPILIPLIILSVRRAYDLAEAMECRCYNGGIGKQRMKKFKIRYFDILALILTTIFGTGVVLLNIFMR
ncbi:MAG: energy-coupling factor transporter transmembrane protein EcfT [Ruminococcaceae bacterium]|nr:energy-coupling factor transporter transmembrane protein EcfT [Oscillospiraceae bacterium]